ncbi:MAG: hypothetical protein IPQ05_11950 [Leptospiraceae bacterium]|nr:hypothetical protein [Leptospiraceae bacterium]
MNKQTPLKEREFGLLILAYRKSLQKRYSRENLNRFQEFTSIDQATVDRLTSYFLELLYPELEERIKLDQAFDALASFVHSPDKMFGLLGSVGTIIFKFGKQFFSAAKAGVSALKSYVTAHKFEAILYDHAKKLIAEGKDIEEEIYFNRLIASIPQKEADDFRHQIVSLFATLSKKELLAKILEVLDYVIGKMKLKPETYTEADIDGISLGKGIIIRGKDVFTELSQEKIQLILKGIDTIEKDFYERALKENKT